MTRPPPHQPINLTPITRIMAHLVLYESWVPAGFEQMCCVGASEGVQVQAVR